MATTNTFADFFDAVAQTEIIEGQVWMDDWQKCVNADVWQGVRELPLTTERVRIFAEVMVGAFQERMSQICTDALYASTLTAGHAFLKEIRAKAKEFEIDLAAVVDVPVTPTEALFKLQGSQVR